MFADDTTTINYDSSLSNLNESTRAVSNRIEDWYALNKLSLNNEKSQKLTLALRPIDQNNNDAVKFLGIHLDPKLSWENHINELTKKLMKKIYLIRSLSNMLSPECLKQVYFAYFHSVMSYAILIWGHSSHMAKIFKNQRRCIRLIANIGYRTDCRDAYRSLRILTTPCVYILECLTYIRNNCDNYNVNRDYHSYSTRINNDFRINYLRLCKSRDSVNYYAPMCYNVLPERVRDLPPISFKRVMKTYLISKCFYSVQEFLNNSFSDLVDC